MIVKSITRAIFVDSGFEGKEERVWLNVPKDKADGNSQG